MREQTLHRNIPTFSGILVRALQPSSGLWIRVVAITDHRLYCNICPNCKCLPLSLNNCIGGSEVRSGGYFRAVFLRRLCLLFSRHSHRTATPAGGHFDTRKMLNSLSGAFSVRYSWCVRQAAIVAIWNSYRYREQKV